MNRLAALLKPLRNRVMLMVGRCVLSAVYDNKGIQASQVKLLQDEVRDQVERMQEYGFTSVPIAGAEGLAVFVNGNRDHGVVIATDDRRYRLKGLKNGEVAIYTDEGDKIHLKRGNEIEIVSATKVIIDTPTLEVTGDIECEGDITDRINTNAESINDMRNTYNTHTHTGDDGGNTSVPHQLMQ